MNELPGTNFPFGGKVGVTRGILVADDPVKCCEDSGVKESSLHEAGIGQPVFLIRV